MIKKTAYGFALLLCLFSVHALSHAVIGGGTSGSSGTTNISGIINGSDATLNDLELGSLSNRLTNITINVTAPNGSQFPGNKLSTGYVNMTTNTVLLRLNESAGAQVFIDASGNNYHARNGTSGGSYTAGTAGILNASVTFTAASISASTYLYNDTQSGISGNMNRSLVWWAKSASNSADKVNVMLGYGTSCSSNQHFAASPGTTTWAIYGCSGAYDESISVNRNILDTNWHNLAVTYDNTTRNISIYADGELIGSIIRTAGKAYNTKAGYKIAQFADNNRAFSGSLDEIAFFSSVLTAAQIRAIYLNQSFVSVISSSTTNITQTMRVNAIVNMENLTITTLNGSNITNLNAGQLTTGTVATSRLGSGTADSSTYLRGDSSWSTISYADNAGYADYAAGSDSANYAAASGWDFSVNNDLFVTGKVYSTGGYDPPYILLDRQTQSQALKRIKYEVPIDKFGGIALWWNGTRLMGVTSQNNVTALIYEFSMTLRQTVPIPNTLNTTYAQKYYFDSLDGTVKVSNSVQSNGYRIAPGVLLNETDGTFYNLTYATVTTPEVIYDESTGRHVTIYTKTIETNKAVIPANLAIITTR